MHGTPGPSQLNVFLPYPSLPSSSIHPHRRYCQKRRNSNGISDAAIHRLLARIPSQFGSIFVTGLVREETIGYNITPRERVLLDVLHGLRLSTASSPSACQNNTAHLS